MMQVYILATLATMKIIGVSSQYVRKQNKTKQNNILWFISAEKNN